VRIVGEDGMSGGGHGSVHHPVVAALLGRQAHGSHGLAVGGEDVGGDRGKVEAWGNLERDCGLQADELEGALQAESLDVLGVGNLLPNANQAYYRVVAMDALGKRSGDSDYVEAPRPFIYSMPVTSAAAGRPYRYQVQAIRSLGDLARRDGARPKPGTKFWKIEPLKFSLTQKPDWMRIDPDTGLITGTPDGTGGPVTVSVTLTKEHRLVHDENAIVWGNEYEKEKTYEVVGPVIQQFVVK